MKYAQIILRKKIWETGSFLRLLLCNFNYKYPYWFKDEDTKIDVNFDQKGLSEPFR